MELVHKTAHHWLPDVHGQGLLQEGQLCGEEGSRQQQLGRTFSITLRELQGLAIHSCDLDGFACGLLHYRLRDSHQEALSLGQQGQSSYGWASGFQGSGAQTGLGHEMLEA